MSVVIGKGASLKLASEVKSVDEQPSALDSGSSNDRQLDRAIEAKASQPRSCSDEAGIDVDPVRGEFDIRTADQLTNDHHRGARATARLGGDAASRLSTGSVAPNIVDQSALAEAAAISPRAREIDPAGPDYVYSRRIACLSDPAGNAAASYRSLQTRLLAGHVRDGRRGLALCAPTPEAGCTTVAVNLAVAFAQAGVNTLLVDANLRRPAVHDFIRPVRPVLGLAQMLAADPNLRVDEIRRDVRPNLSLLYAGGVPPKSHDLLANRRFKQVIDDCMRSFEFTIVDTPALCGSTDARHIAMSVRYGLVIARRDVTLLADIRNAIDELSSDRVRLIGSFLADF